MRVDIWNSGRLRGSPTIQAPGQWFLDRPAGRKAQRLPAGSRSTCPLRRLDRRRPGVPPRSPVCATSCTRRRPSSAQSRPNRPRTGTEPSPADAVSGAGVDPRLQSGLPRWPKRASARGAIRWGSESPDHRPFDCFGLSSGAYARRGSDPSLTDHGSSPRTAPRSDRKHLLPGRSRVLSAT